MTTNSSTESINLSGDLLLSMRPCLFRSFLRLALLPIFTWLSSCAAPSRSLHSHLASFARYVSLQRRLIAYALSSSSPWLSSSSRPSTHCLRFFSPQLSSASLLSRHSPSCTFNASRITLMAPGTRLSLPNATIKWAADRPSVSLKWVIFLFCQWGGSWQGFLEEFSHRFFVPFASNRRSTECGQRCVQCPHVAQCQFLHSCPYQQPRQNGPLLREGARVVVLEIGNIHVSAGRGSC
mmetsp:Transcript_39248/g.98270  ORF Transcript_39248/g.98270 Transcript_39248/m.98270 type:complete len:237 (+) Transcript_39248:649-1359(+)